MLYFDHLNDQVSYILCPPGDDSIEPLVHRAGLPAKLPPAVNIDELAGPDPLPSSFDKPLQDNTLMTNCPRILSILILCLRILHHNFTTMTLTMTNPMTLPRIRRESTGMRTRENDDSDDDDVILEFSLV